MTEVVLADTSVVRWAVRSPSLWAHLESLARRRLLATCVPVDLEVAQSARSPEMYRRIVGERGEYLVDLPLTPAVASRARQVEAQLARRGFRQVAAPAVWTIAACAEIHGALLLHCDQDFVRIAAVTGQPVQRLAPPGLLP